MLSASDNTGVILSDTQNITLLYTFDIQESLCNTFGEKCYTNVRVSAEIGLVVAYPGKMSGLMSG